MGCDGSKPANEGMNGVGNENGELFTENQLDTIRSTWPLLSQDMTSHGTRLFLLAFETEPKIKLVFQQFSDLNEEELPDNSSFQSHVTKFMQLIDDVVNNIDEQKDEVEKALLLLGAKHASIHGFKCEYFHIFSKCMLQVLESVIGEEFIPEIKDSWITMFSYITRFMTEGCTIYTEV